MGLQHTVLSVKLCKWHPWMQGGAGGKQWLDRTDDNAEICTAHRAEFPDDSGKGGEH